MSEELHFPVVQPVLASQADRACRIQESMEVGVSDEVVAVLESDDDYVWSR